jgi:predicted hydrocarbon binding protein
LASNGEYVSTELYEDSELVTLTDALGERVGKTREELYREFGHYFFPVLMSMAIKYVEGITDLFDFMRAVDSVIHIEVKKSDPLAYTPTLLYDQPKDDVLIVRYSSHRKMCHFAEGLILGAADYFKQPVTLSQTMVLLSSTLKESMPLGEILTLLSSVAVPTK